MNEPIQQKPDARFLSARPVWPTGREREMNLLVGFRCAFQAPTGEGVLLRVAACTTYRAFLNGRFFSHGPARGPHGFFRVDEIDLTGKLQPGRNVLAIEVAGYNVNGTSIIEQPSFLQAEVVAGVKVLASTAGQGDSFVAGPCAYLVQKVQRYNRWRAFLEVYRLREDYDRWRADEAAFLPPCDLAVGEGKAWLRRGVPLATFTIRRPQLHCASGAIEPRMAGPEEKRHTSITRMGPLRKAFPEAELEVIPTDEMGRLAFRHEREIDQEWKGSPVAELSERRYHLLDFGTNLTGFIGAEIVCESPTRLWLVFDEVLVNGDIDINRINCASMVEVNMEEGRYRFEAIEPYTLRYLKLACLSGACEVRDIYLREYAFPEVAAEFRAGDERLNKIYQAGVETFRQNSPDLFMDCPSRERAAWLGDSFFTARAAYDLGGLAVERNFLENYLLASSYGPLPKGMLPMCYPAEHPAGGFIPNWAMWFVVELGEYAARSGDGAMVQAFRQKVLDLLEYFMPFENEDGLLEKLDSWIFVEWSKAGGFVQDVNYPTNMLYAGMLDATGRMYGLPELCDKARRLRGAIREQSFDGEFFVDNAVRRDGKLEVTRNRSEACQYYAFFFDVASQTSHSQLWSVLRDQFGPRRAQTEAFLEVHPANSFIGNMLRIEILSRYGCCQQVLDESIDYLLYMAESTGTLWENATPDGSCNHGFASHIVHTFYRDILGLRRVDIPGKGVNVRFGALRLERCQGRIPTPEGFVELAWRKGKGRLQYRLRVPPGFAVEIENTSGLELIAEG